MKSGTSPAGPHRPLGGLARLIGRVPVWAVFVGATLASIGIASYQLYWMVVPGAGGTRFDDYTGAATSPNTPFGLALAVIGYTSIYCGTLGLALTTIQCVYRKSNLGIVLVILGGIALSSFLDLVLVSGRQWFWQILEFTAVLLSLVVVDLVFRNTRLVRAVMCLTFTFFVFLAEKLATVYLFLKSVDPADVEIWWTVDSVVDMIQLSLISRGPIFLPFVLAWIITPPLHGDGSWTGRGDARPSA